MKRAEWKVREEIGKFLLAHVNCDWEWKGHVGEVWVEAKRIAENTIINCFCFSTQFIRLRVSEGKVVQFKVAPVGQGLTQLRWFLEQIKKR
jgi:hypothetical protein